MSGVIGHMMYAILGGKAAEQRRLPVVPLLNRYYASYLAGAYLGCDVQTLPAAICVDTGLCRQDPQLGSPVPWKPGRTGRR